MRQLHRLLFVMLLCSVSFASDNRFLRLEQSVIKEQLRSAPSDLTERVAMVRSAFKNAGCTAEQITEQAVPEQPAPNILCTLPGKQEGTIVVAARLDYRSKGNELEVESATLNMLPLLAQSLYPTELRYSFVFIALTGYDHHVGAEYYLSHLTDAQKKSIRGMVFLDHLGRSPAHYLFPSQANDSNIASMARDVKEANYGSKRSTHSDSPLRKQLTLAAKTLKMEDPEELSEFFLTDALNFERQRILALTLTSPAYTVIVRDVGRIERRMPRVEFDMPVYYQTYDLLCAYLLYLDNTLEARK